MKNDISCKSNALQGCCLQTEEQKLAAVCLCSIDSHLCAESAGPCQGYVLECHFPLDDKVI